MMDKPDFKRAYQLAQMSNAAYLIDLNELSLQIAQIGLNLVGVVEAPGFQAVVATENDGSQIVAYRGTPVTCARDIEDWLVAIGNDLGLKHTDVGAGAKVLTTPYQAVKGNWLRIARLLDLSKPLTLTGHSLGAVMALITSALIDRATNLTVIVFAPFQAANAAFWSAVYGGRRAPLIFGRAADFAPGWNHIDSITCHAATICHLIGGRWAWLRLWPWHDDSVSDHAVADYVGDVKALADA